jgi:hypothetical protein
MAEKRTRHTAGRSDGHKHRMTGVWENNASQASPILTPDPNRTRFTYEDGGQHRLGRR